MRSFIVMAMFVTTLAHGAWSDYEEVRELNLDAKGIESLSIKAGDGSMDVTGVEGLDAISVVATIVVPDADEEDAQKIMSKEMNLALDRKGDTGHLKSWFDQGFMGLGSNAYIALEVSVPAGMSVSIDDGGGSLDVTDVAGDVTINDGSGSIDVHNARHVKIDDGSGSIDVVKANGDVSIIDGSGSITVRGVSGSVTIDDGSGGIRVSDVEKDLIILDDGSGGLRYSDVRGTVDAET